ncbi:MAG: mannitol dehydrogenase family protein [Rhizobiaceae bacterium]
MTIDLSAAALDALPAEVAGPLYDRGALSAGIVHIGVGNFHRAHQAVYLDRLFDLGHGHDWAIVGAGVRPADEAMRADLEAQDWLTTVVELNPDGLNARVCGAMIGHVAVDPAALVERMSRPDIRIVTLTVTEGGYYLDATGHGFRHDHPDILEDAANPAAPKTVFGCILASLVRRREAGEAPFTVVSCDNIPENGQVTRNAVVGLARAGSPALADWVEANVAFPNGMVDCITPATSDRERALVADRFGIADRRPVVCEPFRQWVLEDRFTAGRPALERVGVEFVDDVAPYELMKLRVLNGGHAAIAYAAGLLGIHFVHEAMAHPLVDGFLRKLAIDEIIPTLTPIAGVDFQAYLASVAQRFANPEVGDTVARLCLDGSNRQPKFILPVIQERLRAGAPIAGLALETALWCRYCAATDEVGNTIFVDDERAAELAVRAEAARADPHRFLELRDVFGSLGDNETYRGAFAAALTFVWEHGAEAALRRYLDLAEAGDAPGAARG